MLSSGAHSAQDRRNKRAAVKKAALSSRVSLLSAITASSSGSSGSGSTITQESVSRPRVRGPKSNVNSKGKRQRTAASSTSTKEKSAPRESKGIIDVFTFLEKDQSHSSLVQQRSRSGSTGDQAGTKYPTHDVSDPESDPRSFHSDSGISLNDAGSDHDSPKMNHTFGRRLGTLQEEDIPRHHNADVREQRYHQKLQTIPQDIDEDHPEWYYCVRDDSCVATAIGVDATSVHTEEPESSGYDLLATRLCSSQESLKQSLPPIYRRFENLNHRILLQLQDEIAEMEEDLQHMDRADALERAARHGRAVPASRRLDWQWRGSELHARRLELLGRIYLKVEQYSKSFNHRIRRAIRADPQPDQAISSFQRVGHTTSPPLANDVERYRKWMVENKPVADAEAAYLEKQNDLLSLNQPKSDPKTKLTPILTQPTALMMTITSATALPILLFRIIPGFSSRITVILLLLPFVAFIPKLDATASLLNRKESQHFLSVYFGVLVLSALVI